MNKNKGISLVVLVVTIVVIIILAAAVILNITDTNPINSANVTKVATNYDNMKTDISLFINSAKVETKAYFTTKEILTGTGSVRKGINFEDNDKVTKNEDDTWNANGYKLISDVTADAQNIQLNNEIVRAYKISDTQYKTLINKIPETPTTDGNWYIDLDGNVYLVYETKEDIPDWLKGKAGEGKITDDETLAMFLAVKTTETTANLVNESPTEFYGSTVTNYTANGVNSWKVFHSDGTNIYLISSDYVKISTLTNAVGDDTYGSGISSIATDNPARKWLKYTSENDNSNAKAVAYLMDTDEWSSYKSADVDVDWVIGGPTLELFTESYNNYYKYNKEVTVKSIGYDMTSGSYGYKVNKNNGNYGNEISGLANNELYVISSTTKARAMWLTSLSNVGGQAMLCVVSGGTITNAGYGEVEIKIGFRPIVCLNKDVKLVNNNDGTVTLK